MGGGVDQGVQLAPSGFTGIVDRLGALSRVNRPTEEDAYAGAREGTSSHPTVRLLTSCKAFKRQPWLLTHSKLLSVLDSHLSSGYATF